jgi:hypothetical protein
LKIFYYLGSIYLSYVEKFRMTITEHNTEAVTDPVTGCCNEQNWVTSWGFTPEKAAAIHRQVQNQDPNAYPVRLEEGHFIVRVTDPNTIRENEQKEEYEKNSGRLRTCVTDHKLYGNWWRHLGRKEGKEMELAYWEWQANEAESAERAARGCNCLPRTDGNDAYCRCELQM